FEEREALSRENVYAPFDPAPFEGDARRELIRRFIRTYGPVPLQGIIGYTGFLPWEVHEAMEGLDIVRISVGGGRTDMFLMADELEDLEFPVSNGRETRILSLYDPEVQPLWSEVSSRYGDRWIYPILRDGTLVGAAEKWNMSGCIEIRALDLDDMGLLPDALRALDEMMAYYNQLGYDVIRIREIGGVAVDQLPAGVAAQLTQEGYRLIGTSMVKGNVVPIAFPWEKALALILFRQAIPSEMRYEDILEGAKATGGFRSDPGASLRCRVSVPLKKLFEQGTLVRMQAVPEFITYTTVQHASLYRKVKGGARTEDMNLLLRVLEDKSPISKGELFDLSPVGHKRTSEALKALYLAAHVYVDRSRKIALVPDNGMSVQEARVELLRVMFRNYGIFSAENLSRFLKFELTMGEIRECLASLEREGFLVKGYFIKGDDTLHWMLKDLEAANEEFEEGFVLTRDDNLHFYLQPWLKAQIGFPANVIFKGTRIVGSFRAGHRGKDLYLVEFNGDQEARRIFNDYLRANGLTLRRKKDEGIPDWEIEEFYEKTHPGEA
ncbi:MAG: winged helix DNA-binding domain-containing protein, partial [Euryarchaeota archaeon]|nr:winged helix DNA-binding domain-containing protein [Euryarchaeota archaeon]